jgi:hypothetical protein
MVKTLDELLTSVDPALLHPTHAVKLLDAASDVEVRAASLKTLLAGRAADAGEWAREGYHSPEDCLAHKKTGTGAVPVSEAIGAILARAFVKVLLHHGTDVSKVAHVGRHIPAELKTAILERDNYTCVRPGRGATSHLEIHHYKVPHAKGGPAAYWNLLATS